MTRTALLETTTSNVKATHALAAAVAGQCRLGDCILLTGDLGTGKTEFARGFIQSLQAEISNVTSPTFMLAQPYPARSGATLWHFDLYRLKDQTQLQELGLEEALDSGISLIEWPDFARPFAPASALDIAIRYGENDVGRCFTLEGEAVLWTKRLAEVERALV